MNKVNIQSQYLQNIKTINITKNKKTEGIITSFGILDQKGSTSLFVIDFTSLRFFP